MIRFGTAYFGQFLLQSCKSATGLASNPIDENLRSMFSCTCIQPNDDSLHRVFKYGILTLQPKL
jgi:hypothetical protein